MIGRQYQDHNPRPGPVYAGGGYTPTTKAVHAGEPALKKLLDKYPHLVNDVSTGGATPLHMCGMSRRGQASTAFLANFEVSFAVRSRDASSPQPLIPFIPSFPFSLVGDADHAYKIQGRERRSCGYIRISPPAQDGLE